MATRSVLFLNASGCPELPPLHALSIFTHGSQFAALTDLTAAKEFLVNNPSCNILVSNYPDFDLFQTSRDLQPHRTNILVTDLIMDEYSARLNGAEGQLLDHVIAHRADPFALENELRTTLQKLISEDIFGLDKYLAPGTQINEVTVTGGDRDQYNNVVMKFAEGCHLGSHLAKSIWGICEEMLMNAIYDAPEAAGIPRFRNLPRNSRIHLDAGEEARLRFGFDGNYFAIGVEDPFGMMNKDKLNQYTRKILNRGAIDKILDDKKGGAGLGLFKILYSSHGVAINVQPNKRTEIISLIDINIQIRDFGKMPRSIHYFSVG